MKYPLWWEWFKGSILISFTENINIFNFKSFVICFFLKRKSKIELKLMSERKNKEKWNENKKKKNETKTEKKKKSKNCC